MRRLIPILCVTLLISACATTPKQPKSFDQIGQFSTYPLNAQSYRISFKAPDYMSYATAEEMTLVKSAQTTVQQGFQFFKVTSGINQSNTAPRQAVVYPTPIYSPYYRHPFFYDPFFYSPQVVQIDPIQVVYHIEMYHENKQPRDAFDARLILQSLGQKYAVSVTGEILTPPTVETQKP